MSPADYNARAAYYERLAVEFGRARAYDSVRFYNECAMRCREYAGYREAA